MSCLLLTFVFIKNNNIQSFHNGSEFPLYNSPHWQPVCLPLRLQVAGLWYALTLTSLTLKITTNTQINQQLHQQKQDNNYSQTSECESEKKCTNGVKLVSFLYQKKLQKELVLTANKYTTIYRNSCKKIWKKKKKRWRKRQKNKIKSPDSHKLNMLTASGFWLTGNSQSCSKWSKCDNHSHLSMWRRPVGTNVKSLWWQ